MISATPVSKVGSLIVMRHTTLFHKSGNESDNLHYMSIDDVISVPRDLPGIVVDHVKGTGKVRILLVNGVVGWTWSNNLTPRPR